MVALKERKNGTTITRISIYFLLCSFLFIMFLYQLFNFLHSFAATQCFSRVVPTTPNHGLTSIPTLNAKHQTFNLSFFHASHQIVGIPLLVRDFTRDWPALKRWQDVTYFGKLCGDNFTERFHGLTLLEYTSYLQEFDLDLRDTYNTKHRDVDLYFKHNEALFYYCPALFEDVYHFQTARSHASKPTTFLANLARSVIGLFEVEFLPSDFIWGDWIQAVTWIGPNNKYSHTKLHYDDDPLSLLYQFKGTKKIRLWSSDQSHLMYPNENCLSLDEYGTRFSMLSGNPMKMTEGEKKLYPLIETAEFLDVTLLPGDMLYIPSGWWHYVQVEDGSSVSVSVASRSYSTCEGVSYFPNFLVNWIHSFGMVDMTGFCIRPSS